MDTLASVVLFIIDIMFYAAGFNEYDIDMTEIFKGVAPFFLAELIRISILFSLPVLALWLPSILSG